MPVGRKTLPFFLLMMPIMQQVILIIDPEYANSVRGFMTLLLSLSLTFASAVMTVYNLMREP